MILTVGVESDQHVNICSLSYVVIRCGLALNDTGFILVRATCPTSSLSRSVTLFLSPGARSLLWGYKRKGERGGTRGPVRLWSEGPRMTEAPLCAKCSSMCSRFEPSGSAIVCG